MLLFAVCQASAQVTQINISHDLTSLGISSRNAIPGNPDLDTRPLLQAAILYAANNSISKITADRGSYWFLTAQMTDRYLVLDHLSDLTIDLQGSDLFLKSSYLIGFDLVGCQRVSLANFTIDFLQLPFTQVRLTSVSGGNRTLNYEMIPGWPSPSALRSPGGSTDFWAIVLRAGSIPANTNRLPLTRPKDATSLQVRSETSPWTQPSVLDTYRPGDIVVVTLKDGDAPILVEGGDSIVINGIEVYASGTLGIHLDSTRNSTVSNVRVMPRPGTDRLISTNADGIHLSYIQDNNHVKSCYVNRTMDDGIALNSPFVAFVDRPLSTRDLVITRNYQTRVPNGTVLAFINPNTGETFGRFTIVGQNPPFDSPSSYNESATYTFDQDLPAVRAGFGLVYTDSLNRGLSSGVENNLVEDILFARGIFLGGVSGVTVEKNTVRRTNCGGIVIHHELAAYPSAANQDIQVIANTVDGAIGPAAVGTGAISALGSIFVLSTDSSFVPLAVPTANNITIAYNYISNAGRTGIWAGNIDGGAIKGNTISGYSLYPQLALWGVSEAFGNQLAQDFTQAVVVRSSRNVAVQKDQQFRRLE